jgi:hypothetical protein
MNVFLSAAIIVTFASHSLAQAQAPSPASAYPPQARAVSVTTPEEFQEAVRAATPHVVVNAHMDFTNTPKFAEYIEMDDGMVAILPNGQDIHTSTIRVQIPHLQA